MKNIVLKALASAFVIIMACNKVNAANTSDTTKKTTTVSDTFEVTEMGCSTDSKMVEKALYRKLGVKKVNINGEKITVTYLPSKVKRTELIAVIENTGTCEDPNAKVHKVKILNP